MERREKTSTSGASAGGSRTAPPSISAQGIRPLNKRRRKEPARRPACDAATGVTSDRHQTLDQASNWAASATLLARRSTDQSLDTHLKRDARCARSSLGVHGRRQRVSSPPHLCRCRNPRHPTRQVVRKGASLAASSAPPGMCNDHRAFSSSETTLHELSIVPTVHLCVRPDTTKSSCELLTAHIIRYSVMVAFGSSRKDAFPRPQRAIELEDIPRRTPWLPFVTCAVRGPGFTAGVSHTRTFAQPPVESNIRRVRALVNGTPKR